MQYLYVYDELTPEAQEMAEHHIITEYGLTGQKFTKYDLIDYCRCFIWDHSGFPIAKDTTRREAFLFREIEESLGRLERTGDIDHIHDIRSWVEKLKKTTRVAAKVISNTR